MSFSWIDALNRSEHRELKDEDRCIFLREYKAKAGYAGETNSLIWNLKKKPSNCGRPDYRHKMRCIRQVSREFCSHLDPEWLDVETLIPIPGSKSIGHPDHDDRMVHICKDIRPGLDVRSIVAQTASVRTTHEAGDGHRQSVEQLLELCQIVEELTDPSPVNIRIFDDIITVGRHFRAMCTILSQRFPGIPIKGIFIARTINQGL